MADGTDTTLRNMTAYQVYVRNHSEEGTFRALEADLDRIAELADIIYLLPVHPIGRRNRKGTLGSPYAISDYRAVNPELGTAEDFDSLINAIHRRGMKCVMDIVYNHTSPDSVLAREHPQWFYQKPGGGPGNRIGEWWDVIDLDYADPASGLWEYQIETLKTWAAKVDGFRCDVASLVPLEFWLRAREAAAAVNPRCFWIAESVEPPFILENRERGFACHSDGELFRAFDVCYDYDIFARFKRYLEGTGTLAAYAGGINAQEYAYPDNYVKLRCLENHDQSRAAFSIPGAAALRNWTAFNYFQKGLAMIYAGQEWRNDFRPSLFEKDVIRRPAGNVDGNGGARDNGDGADLVPLLKALYKLKKEPLFAASRYEVMVPSERADVLLAIHRPRRSQPGLSAMAGVFSFKGFEGPVSLETLAAPGGGGASPEISDGVYTNLIDGSALRVEGGRIRVRGDPVIFRL
ncbi:MAG: hypothetical protein LBD09_04480, partial [Treponema sp.]|nr:hypothetical protein [Treponema sp.]